MPFPFFVTLIYKLLYYCASFCNYFFYYLFIFLLYIYELNKQFFSVVQNFVKLWGKMEALGPALEGSLKYRK